MRMVPGEAIRRQDEHVIDRAHHGPISERIQPRAGQGGPTEAVVSKDQVGIEPIALLVDIGVQARELGLDGAFFNLAITGYSGVKGDVFWHRVSPRCGGVSFPPPAVR